MKNSKDIVSYQPNAYKLLTSNGNDKKFFVTSNDGNVTIHFDKVVDEIYTQGYRKIPEGSVVLTKGAYESLSNKAKANVVKAVEIRKQAVKEFADRLKSKMEERSCGEIKYKQGIFFDYMLDELAKEFGVDIKE